MMSDTGGDAALDSLLLTRGNQPSAASGERLIEIVVPVYNEEKVLEASVRRLHSYLTDNLPFRFVVTYMDADLSTGLDAFLPLIAPLLSGHSDLAIGSRLAHGAQVVRGPKREIISRAYNLLLRAVLAARFSDAQCGFKAGRADVIRALLPAVEDDAWFFDTELLMLAQRQGLRIYQIPVAWTEDPDTTVEIIRTAVADLRGVARLCFASPSQHRLSVRPPRPGGTSDGHQASTQCRSACTELTAPE